MAMALIRIIISLGSRMKGLAAVVGNRGPPFSRTRYLVFVFSGDVIVQDLSIYCLLSGRSLAVDWIVLVIVIVLGIISLLVCVWYRL